MSYPVMFVLEIEVNNDAFFTQYASSDHENPDEPEFAPELEVARLLREAATQIENRGIEARYLHDYNGNPVGSYGFVNSDGERKEPS
jgi:hypothetical protein